jgi:predicted NBD/HSP70 family sugar kinase
MKKQIGQPHMINMVNRNLILEIIKEKGPISKPDIVKITKLSLPTVNKIISILQEEGVVKEFGIGETRSGRKPILYTINGEAGLVIAIYIEDNQVNGVLADIMGEFLNEGIIKRNFTSTQEVLKVMFELIDHLISKVKSQEDIKAIGVGVPGVVRKDGTIFNIFSIPEWEGINLKEILEARYNKPIFLENDVNLTAVGIYHDRLSKKYKNIAYLYFGKGIGSGIIIDNKLYRGANCFAGEISNLIMNIDDNFEDKERYTLLIESQISKLIRTIMKNKGISDTSELKEILENIDDNDADLLQLVNYISYVMNNVICILDPEMVILRGDYIGKKFFSRVKKNVIKLNNIENHTKIILLEESDAGIKGTINLCLSQINPNYLLVINRGI